MANNKPHVMDCMRNNNVNGPLTTKNIANDQSQVKDNSEIATNTEYGQMISHTTTTTGYNRSDFGL